MKNTTLLNNQLIVLLSSNILATAASQSVTHIQISFSKILKITALSYVYL